MPPGRPLQTCDRVRGREEPRLVFAPRQHYLDEPVAACVCGPLQDRCSKSRRAVIVGVEDDQDGATKPRPAGRQVHIPLQFVLLEEAIALDPNRPWHVRDDIGNGGGYSPDQDRHGVHLARSFHDRDDCRHWSGAALEQIELAGS